MMNLAKIFKNGDSQAIRLPKAFRFDSKEVYIRFEGKNVVLSPIKNTLDNFWDTLNQFSPDVNLKRNQPKKFDKRETI